MRQTAVGDKYARWVVLSEAAPKVYNGKTFKVFLCQCACGTEKEVIDGNLRRGLSKSCGCLLKEMIASASLTHGHTQGRKVSRTYRAWQSMMSRCYIPSSTSYEYYGQRGIKVCGAWHDFENFFTDMGDVPTGRSLDRTDPEAGYCKDNCTWADAHTQALHRRTVGTQLITYEGQTLSPQQWSKLLGIRIGTIQSRRGRGMPANKILYVGKHRTGRQP